MRSKYEYFVKVDEKIFPLPVKVWKEGTRFMIKEAHYASITGDPSESNMYRRFEESLKISLMTAHVSGKLWQIFPEYYPEFRAETCRLIAVPRKPWWKKIHNLALRYFEK